MRRIALIGIICIAAKLAADVPAAFLLLIPFWIGSMNWIERVGETQKNHRS